VAGAAGGRFGYRGAVPRPASAGLTAPSEESESESTANAQNNNNNQNNNSRGAGNGPVLVSNCEYQTKNFTISASNKTPFRFSRSETSLQERTRGTIRRWGSQNSPAQNADVQPEPEHHHRVPAAAVLRRDSGRNVGFRIGIGNWVGIGIRIWIEGYAAAL